MAQAAPQTLIFGEDPATEHVVDARHWLNVYQQLLEFHSDLLPRLTGEADGPPEPARSPLAEADFAALRAHVEHVQSRLEFWERRSLLLGGIDFDASARRLGSGRSEVQLTRREAELLQLLLRHPGREFTAGAIAAMAWNDRRLSPEQVRTYIGRVRRKLARSGLPCAVSTSPRRGYALVFGQALAPGRAASGQQPPQALR